MTLLERVKGIISRLISKIWDQRTIHEIYETYAETHTTKYDLTVQMLQDCFGNLIFANINWHYFLLQMKERRQYEIQLTKEVDDCYTMNIASTLNPNILTHLATTYVNADTDEYKIKINSNFTRMFGIVLRVIYESALPGTHDDPDNAKIDSPEDFLERSEKF